MEVYVSKLYGPPKRRSTCTIRKFPHGCGASTAEIITEQLIQSSQVAPSFEPACTVKEEGCAEDLSLAEDKVTNGINMHAEKAETIAEKSVQVNPLAPSSETARAEKAEGCAEDVALPEENGLNGTNLCAEKSETIIEQPVQVNQLAPSSEAICTENKEGWYIEHVALQEDNVSNGVNDCAEKAFVDNDIMNKTKDEMRVFAPSPIGDIEAESYTSKLYGPPKKRKWSAIRHFPPGCAPLAVGKIQPSGSPGLYISPEANNLIQGKEFIVDKIQPIEDSSPAKGSWKSGIGFSGGFDSNQDTMVIDVPTTNMTEGDISPNDSKKDMFDDAMDMFEIEKKSSQTRVRSLSEPDTSKKKLKKRKLPLGEAQLTNKFLMEDSKGLPKKAKTEKLMEKSSTKALSATLDEKSQIKISRGKELSSSYSKIPKKAGEAEKDPRSPVGKSVLVKHEKAVKKQKHREEPEEDKGESTPVCKYDNVNSGSDRDRIIVLALAVAPNCPWQRGKGSLRAEQQSSSKSAKLKRNTKSSAKNLALSKLSESRDICPTEGQKEELQSSNTPQDEEFSDKETEKGGSARDYQLDLSVMETPVKPLDLDYTGIPEEVGIRNKVRRALRLFQVICRKLLQGEESKSKGKGKFNRVDLEAARIMKMKNEYVNPGKPILGLVPGVEIGDEFHYRTELAIIGLHRQFQAGIDKAKVGDIFLATSIVAGCSSDEMESSDILVYSGSGGSSGDEDKPPEDQKLEGGNLALKNSMEAKQPVRVIRGSKEVRVDSRDSKGKSLSTFVYDGLYIIEKYWKERVPQGYLALKFELRRMPGQPELPSKEVKKSHKPSIRPGVCVKDISDGKEKMPICVVNTIDDDRPLPFRYITRIRYPSSCELKAPKGCDCTEGCSDSENCACAVRNGGEIPYNYNGAIVQAKPLVYECGPMCKCPPTCHNRVSQHGIKIQLEVFKTKSMGWGVRSLSSIPSGSFICEYIGELIPDKEAELRTNDDYLFDIGHNYDDSSLWEGLPTLIPETQIGSYQEDKDSGFTIDAAKFANLGRFINHSCSPNLYAQNVLYDHNDKRMPHIMLFAAENIPPLKELTYHYNYMIDQVRDSDGNIKRKDCYCGSDECTGRLY